MRPASGAAAGARACRAIYEVRGGGRSDFIAVNVDPRESRLARWMRPRVKRWLALQAASAASGPAAAQAASAAPRERCYPLWFWLLLGCRGACIHGAVGGELPPARAAGASRMSSRDQLDNYLDQARRRLQLVLAGAERRRCWRGALLVVTLLAAAAAGHARGVRRFAAVHGSRVLLVAGAAGRGRVGLCCAVRAAASRGRRDAAGTRAARAVRSRPRPTCRKAAQGRARPPFLLDLLAEDAAARRRPAEPLARSIPAKRLLDARRGGAALPSRRWRSLFFARWLAGRWRAAPVAGQAAACQPASPRRPAALPCSRATSSVRRNQDLAISALVAGGGAMCSVHVQFEPMATGKPRRWKPDGKGGYRLHAVRRARWRALLRDRRARCAARNTASRWSTCRRSRACA